MKESVIRIILISAASGLMLSPLGGCAQKRVSSEPTEQSAKVEDTIKAKPTSTQPLSSQASLTDGVTGTNEGVGPIESLDTPPPSRDQLYGMAGASEFVEGSRTSLGVLPVYFEFNKSIIHPDQVEKIRTNAMFLKENPAIKARIEGNCDARGTYVYNLALGEYRAAGAKKYLVNLGVAEDRLTTLSYGEEKPVNPRQDEVAWAENRRDDFVIFQ